MRITSCLLSAVLVVMIGAVPVFAEEGEEAPPEPIWKGSPGLSWRGHLISFCG